MKKNNSAVLILAGGKSERMGFPKPFLSLGNTFFLDRIIDEYRVAGVGKIMVVLNGELIQSCYEKYLEIISSKAFIVINKQPEKGRFFSVRSGLERMGSDEFVYIQNVDNPFVRKELIGELWNSRNEFGYASPVYRERGGHPVLLSPSLVKWIKDKGETDTRLDDVLRPFPNTKVEVDDEAVLTNLNTLEEYRHFVS